MIASAASASDDRRRRDDITAPRPARAAASWSRNSIDTGTSCARPSGHNAKASAVSMPYTIDSTSVAGCSAGAIGSGMMRAEYRYDRERQRGAEAGADDCARTAPPARSASNRWRRCRVPVAPSAFIVAIDVALAREVACDGIGDADAADQQRRQRDQRQELAEAFDVAFELRRRLVARADVPAGIREIRALAALDRGDGESLASARRQPQAVLPAHQAAGLQ